jgi:streptogramin lyase
VNISGGTTNFSQPTFIVVDGAENIWIPNHGNDSVTELTASSGYSAASAINITNTTFGTSATNFSSPDGIAIDGSGYIWVSNHHNNTVTRLTMTGAAVTSAVNFSNTTSNFGFNGPDGLVVDQSGNVWIPNDTGNSVTELNTTNGTGVNITSPGFSAPDASAVDQSGNIWTTNTNGNSVTEFVVSSGTVTSATTIFGGSTGFNAPTEIAVDGAGNIWIANSNSNSIGASVTELTKSSGYAVGSAVNILESPPPGGPQGIAVDAAGNVWIANSGDNSVTELPGVAVGLTTLPALAGAPPGS